MGHPIAFHIHQCFHGLDKVFHWDARHAHTVVGALHPFRVLFRPEQQNGIVRRAIGFHTLKTFLCIMKNHSRRVHGKGLIRNNAGVMPAIFRIIVHLEHVIGKDLAKTEMRFIGGFCLRRFCAFNSDIQHGNSLFSKIDLYFTLYLERV